MSGPPTDRTIMIVEDDVSARADLAHLLACRGYATLTADNALAAVNLLRSGARPHLILLDMILPGADGWQFFAERLAAPALGAIPVVVMTGLGVASEEWARALGAVDLIRKPIDVTRLLELVNRHAGPPAAKP
jgi:CheY-like chemotaxis protein